MPFVIVPDAPEPLNITDKEGNGVFRIFVYKPQHEDAIKALRKRGFIPRLFTYDKTKWEADGKERKVLQLEVENKTTELKKTAMAAY